MDLKLFVDKQNKTTKKTHNPLKPAASDGNKHSGSTMTTVHGLAKVEHTQNVYKF